MKNDTTSVSTDIGPFAMIPEWLLYAGVSAGAIQHWCVLARHADGAARCFPSRKRLMELEGVKSVSTIDGRTDELVAVGALSVTTREREDGGQSSNAYHLRFVGNAPSSTHSDRAGARDESRGGGTDEPLAPPRGRSRAKNDTHSFNESHIERDNPEDGREAAAVDIPRADVEHVCDAMRVHAETMTDRQVKITPKWRTDARLLIDRDGYDPETILGAIRWLAADSFWQSNVLSVPTLRRQMPRLYAAAKKQALGNRSGIAAWAAEHGVGR